MSVDKLLAALEKEAQMREAAIMKSAEAEAETILSTANKRAERIDSIIDGLNKAHALKLENARKAGEKIEARSATLGKGWRIVDLAFKLADQRFAHFMQSPQYPPFITARLAEAVDHVGQLDQVAADPVTAEALRGNGFSVVADDTMEKGFAARSREGKTVVRFLLSEAMENLWKRQAHTHHDALFPESGDAG